MKILVFGANGWIGSQFIAYLQKNWSYEIIIGSSRLDDLVSLESELSKIIPTHVVSFIGRTGGWYDGKYIPSIDYLEKPGKLKENVRDNLYSPMVLALFANKYKYHYTYLGTGCIYDYDQSHPIQSDFGFTEEDTPNFFGSSYSAVKNYSDRLLNLVNELNISNTLTLRIRMPITSEVDPKNLITKLSKYQSICSVENSLTILSDYFPIFLDMMEKKVLGVYNCTNPGYISHNELLTMYKEIVDPDFTWQNFTISDQEAKLGNKRCNCFLATDKISLLYDIPNIKDSLRNVMIDYKKSLKL